jgi:hypothetical protein
MLETCFTVSRFMVSRSQWTIGSRSASHRDLLSCKLTHLMCGHHAMFIPTLQRFGIEGCEALLPGLRALAAASAAAGVRRIEVGQEVHE